NTGLRAVVEASGKRPDFFLDQLAHLEALIEVLLGRSFGPYPVLEYGVRYAAEALRETPERLRDAFALAASLAALDKNPTYLLQEGVGRFAHLKEASWDRIVDFAESLVREGIDPSDLLAEGLPSLWRVFKDFEANLDQELSFLFDLSCAIRDGGHVPDRTYRLGFVEAANFCEGREGSLRRALAIARTLADRGVDPAITLKLGVPEILVRGEKAPFAVEPAFQFTEALAASGADPSEALRWAFPAVLAGAGNDPEAFAPMLDSLQALVISLHRNGIATRDLLNYDIRSLTELTAEHHEMFGDLLSRLQAFVETLHRRGIDADASLQSGIPALAKSASGRSWLVEEGIEAGTRLADQGLDPIRILQYGIPGIVEEHEASEASLREFLKELVTFCAEPATAREAPLEMISAGVPSARAVAHDRPDRFSPILRRLRTAFQKQRESEIDPRHLGTSLAPIAKVAGHDEEAFCGLVDFSGERILSLQGRIRELYPLLDYGFPGIGSVAGERPEVFRTLLDALGEDLLKMEGEGVESGPLLRQGLWPVVKIAGKREGVFLRLFRNVAATHRMLSQAGVESEEVLSHGTSVAQAVAREEEDAFSNTLREFCKVFTLEEYAQGRAAVPSDLTRLLSLFRSHPEAWSGLVHPLLQSQRRVARSLLGTIGRIAAHVKAASDLVILREIVTQRGVQAGDALENLVYLGLQTGAIESLTEERDLLRGFLREFSVHDPGFYSTYKKIHDDPALSRRERSEKCATLREELDALSGAIRSGEVKPEQEESPTFPLVLFHLFPPAMSLSRWTYMDQYRRMTDHKDHLEKWNPGEELQGKVYAFRQGSFHIKPGVELDLEPWALLNRIVEDASSAEPVGEPAAGLGRDAMAEWIRGHLSRDPVREELLRRAYDRFRLEGYVLPKDLQSVTTLIAYKEFLSDHLRDILQEALDAHREEDPRRFLQRLRDKLAPPVKVGKGLLKGVWGTIQQRKAGMISVEEANRRLSGQLKAFSLGGSDVLAVLVPARTQQELLALLGRLERGEVHIQPGKETERICADLCGAELAAMNRELFGDAGHPSKLEYRVSDESPAFEIRFEVTKRKAHAVIGYCEGVCVAPDITLWNREDFLQVIFWGPSGVAMGGMHLLIVEEEGKRFLTLPGINPSLRLIGTVKPEEILDTCIDYAWRLARRWNLEGVWIPASPGIHSNRGAIGRAIHEKQYPRKRISDQTFSYSPYAYTFRDILDVPEPETL
ncbi:MAG: hypothetical protein ACYTHN_13840, partial [Planctomycetota bacterium]